jgi:hypothetical protein
MKSVFLAGEDDVTKACLRRLISTYSPQTVISGELPGRGGEIKSLISNFNELSKEYPVLLLVDLDNNGCAPSLKESYLNGIQQTENFIFNVAYDEAEAWLMADKTNFSTYFKFPEKLIPSRTNVGTRRRPYHELDFKYKSSLFLVKELMAKSMDQNLIKMMVPKYDSYKGPEYNSAIIPFINEHWNIEEARLNSDSLNRTILRLISFLN